MAFLITWTTHNSWLPGDPRGFRSYKGKDYVPPPARYTENGSECYDPERFEGLHEFHSPKNCVRLNQEQRQVVADILADTISEMCPGRLAFCVGETHVHVLAELGGRVTVSRFCNFAKGRSARKLIALGHSGKVWARRYHARHIDSSAWDSAKQYVSKHNTGREVIRETNT